MRSVSRVHKGVPTESGRTLRSGRNPAQSGRIRAGFHRHAGNRRNVSGSATECDRGVLHAARNQAGEGLQGRDFRREGRSAWTCRGTQYASALGGHSGGAEVRQTVAVDQTLLRAVRNVLQRRHEGAGGDSGIDPAGLVAGAGAGGNPLGVRADGTGGDRGANEGGDQPY
jgi:hypothetical protein